MHTTASTVPDCANRFATSGSSNAPGTHATLTSAAPWSMQHLLRAARQLLGDVAVEARGDDREPHAGRVERAFR